MSTFPAPRIFPYRNPVPAGAAANAAILERYEEIKRALHARYAAVAGAAKVARQSDNALLAKYEELRSALRARYRHSDV